jgi:hypothetical protein
VVANSSKGAKIILFESLYKQYSRLKFSKIYDRPIAIAGLEQRLVRAFKTNGGYGIFEGNFFGRSLLWERDVSVEKDGMRKIVFPLKQQYRVPTWSWMAYEGAITFMDLLFDGVQWEQHDGEGEGIQWHWTAPRNIDASSSSSVWHTANSDEQIDFVTRARDFVDSALVNNYTKIVYDLGTPPGKDRAVKCVIIGRQKSNGTTDLSAKLEHYILIVASIQNNSEGENVYERVGVGSLLGSWIEQNGSGIKVRIV